MITFDELQNTLNLLAQDINWMAHEKGFYDKPMNIGEKIALCHSELSEALGAMRTRGDDHAEGRLMDEDCPGFANEVIEYADCVIRILDLAHERGYRIGDALVAKMQFNAGRPYKHGKEF